jgi:hypothetical protein
LTPPAPQKGALNETASRELNGLNPIRDSGRLHFDAWTPLRTAMRVTALPTSLPAPSVDLRAYDTR